VRRPTEPSLRPAACWRRLHRDVRLQRAVAHVHGLGARPVGELLVELLDAHGVPPAALDLLLTWRRLDPQLVAAVGADRWPPQPLDAVPPEIRARRAA
jgi:hypothetical protein